MPFAKYAAPRLASVTCDGDSAFTADALAQRLIDEPDLARRARHLGALVALASSEAVAALAGLLANADPAVRANGVEGLRRITPALARPALAALLADPTPDIRIRALDAIDRVPDAEAEGWLTTLVAAERDENVCGAALDLLAEMGTPAALPAIRAARMRFASTPFIAFAADLAITQIAGT